MSMSNSDKNIIILLTILIAYFIFLFAVLGISLYSNNMLSENITTEQFVGTAPMKIYAVYDKDTGVYYAVTEKGGICVMETANGETKLVEQGNGEVVHLNQE